MSTQACNYYQPSLILLRGIDHMRVIMHLFIHMQLTCLWCECEVLWMFKGKVMVVWSSFLYKESPVITVCLGSAFKQHIQTHTAIISKRHINEYTINHLHTTNGRINRPWLTDRHYPPLTWERRGLVPDFINLWGKWGYMKGKRLSKHYPTHTERHSRYHTTMYTEDTHNNAEIF